MDQDSAKEGTGGDRRNWRERLGVGQDLPRISDEFRTDDNDSQPADGESQNGQHNGPRPGTPVAKPAPMAPRFARPAAQRPANGSSSEAEAQGPKPAHSVRIDPLPPGLRPWAATAQPARPAAQAPRHQRPSGEPGADHTRPSVPGPQRSAYGPQRPPVGGPQRPAPSRGPAAYPQATVRSGTAPSAGGDSFGERLRAQREAAERLAQQRLAAARERSGHAGADALTMLSPRRAEAAAQVNPAAQRGSAPQNKPAAGDQPRFTFAQEEIAAAQHETAFTPEAQAPAANHQQRAAPARPAVEPTLHGASHDHAAPAPEYRHEDEGMFEDDQPGLHIAPQRPSAADYSAAYREFEEEFEDEPRRGRGPLLLLLSLAGVAVVSGGLIYWYQQGGDAPGPEAANVPVITAPQEPVKAEMVPQEQPQQAAQPATRKQIYDRIIGEETLEPERLVPTEEEPQLRQVQQPEQQLPGAPVESQTGEPAAGEQDPTESQPLPVPPPPGTGQQGDLLVPGMANNRTASAAPEPAELTLPAPRASSASLDRDEESSRVAAVEPASDDPRPAASEPVETAELRDTTVPDPRTSVRTSIYPELEEPLSYPTTKAESPPPHDLVGEPQERKVAALPEPAPEAAPEAAASPEPAAEAQSEPQPEQEAEQALDVPLPKAKPKPPVRAAAKQPPKPQPQRQAETQPSSSGPVQIIPTDLGSGVTQAPSARAAQQPQAQTPQRRRTIGREPELLSDQGAAYTGFSTGSDVAEARPAEPAAPQQMASLAPEVATQQTASGGGYLVQLASFRSEPDALNAYQKLVQRNPQLVGNLDSHVQEASLGQSGAYYRLGIGPLPDRNAATQLCNALIAAGEKDCLVRRN